MFTCLTLLCVYNDCKIIIQKKRSQRQSFSESSLPEEFVKQQKAYFEEVDAFELAVEEVSVYDSD